MTWVSHCNYRHSFGPSPLQRSRRRKRWTLILVLFPPPLDLMEFGLLSTRSNVREQGVCVPFMHAVEYPRLTRVHETEHPRTSVDDPFLRAVECPCFNSTVSSEKFCHVSLQDGEYPCNQDDLSPLWGIICCTRASTPATITMAMRAASCPRSRLQEASAAKMLCAFIARGRVPYNWEKFSPAFHFVNGMVA